MLAHFWSSVFAREKSQTQCSGNDVNGLNTPDNKLKYFNAADEFLCDRRDCVDQIGFMGALSTFNFN